MRSRSISLALTTLAAVALVGHPAGAKGASSAVITGPGLDPVTIGQRGRDDIYALARLTGLFPTVFESEPQKVLDGKPAGPLGTRYDVAYVFKAPGFKKNIVQQDVYPYAPGGPVTYVAPGQPTFGRARSIGGWFRAGPRLLPYLVDKGLPPSAEGVPGTESEAEGDDDEAAAPAPRPSSGGSGAPWPVVAVLGAAGLAILVVVVRRGRWRSARSTV